MGRSEPDFEGAIRSNFGCGASFVQAVPVQESFKGEPVWDGVVSVFDLVDHSTLDRCYAWALTDEDRTRVVTVLHEGPVDSPRAAVQAWIVNEYRKTD